MKKLVEKIKKYQKQYYLGETEISDNEYDKLLEKLKTIDPKHELLTKIDIIEDADKIKHSHPMLSLEKVSSSNDLFRWIDKISRNDDEIFLVQPKYDGISAKFYANSRRLLTRGDGYYGQDITNKITLIHFFNKNLTHDLLGEIIITNSNFQKCSFTKPDGTPYKTQRNIIPAIMRMKDISKLIGKVKLTFVEYEKFLSYEYKKNELKSNWNQILELINEKTQDFPLDGIVIKIKDKTYAAELGSTAHHPKSQIAFKFDDKEYETELLDVIWSHGKRKITPIAIIKPVKINGVTIERPTLHNAKNIVTNNIQIGDKLTIIRSGDVIPKIVRTTPGKNRKPVHLESCPLCNHDLIYIDPDLFCSNKNCYGNLIERLAQSLKILGFDNIGKSTIQKMIFTFDIKNIVDIFNLDKQNLLLLEGFSHKSSQNLVNNIFKILNNPVEDYKILSCLNIKGIGKNLSKHLLKNNTIEDLLNLNINDLIKIDGVGFDRAKEIINGLKDNKILLIKIKQKFKKIIQTKDDIKNKNQQTICFSGVFPKGKKFYYQLAINSNFEIVDSVTKNLSYLVHEGAVTNKSMRARIYNIKIINTDQFLELL